MQVVTNLDKYVKDRVDKAAKDGVTLQPCILILGDEEEPTQIFVIVNNKFTLVDNLFAAIQYVFAVFWIFDLEYPGGSASSFYEVVEVMVYGFAAPHCDGPGGTTVQVRKVCARYNKFMRRVGENDEEEAVVVEETNPEMVDGAKGLGELTLGHPGADESLFIETNTEEDQQNSAAANNDQTSLLDFIGFEKDNNEAKGSDATGDESGYGSTVPQTLSASDVEEPIDEDALPLKPKRAKQSPPSETSESDKDDDDYDEEIGAPGSVPVSLPAEGMSPDDFYGSIAPPSSRRTRTGAGVRGKKGGKQAGKRRVSK